MNNAKRKTLKGLTLIELILVMAIFSLLLVGVLAFFTPVEKIFKNTTISERTYSHTNNIEELIESKLKYADAVWLFNDSKMDGTSYSLTADGLMSDNEIEEVCKDFANIYYDSVVKYDGTTEKYATGKIHIMHLFNNHDSVGIFDIGQITERTVTFTSDPSATNKLTSSLAAETINDSIVNEAYFKAGDVRYNYYYSLGAGRLVNTNMSGTHDETYRAVDKDTTNAAIDLSYDNLDLCVVTTSNGINGAVTIPDVPSSGFCGFTGFLNPCTLSVANLPLMNIVYCNNKTANRTCKSSTGTYFKQGDATHLAPESFRIAKAGADFIDNQINFVDDIYIIYSYADELA